MQSDVVKYLDKLGFKHSTLGYIYLNEAIEIGLKKRSDLMDMTGPEGIYRRAARKFFEDSGCTPSRVERAMRHSIEIADMVCRDSNGRLPNSEFITRAVDEITMMRESDPPQVCDGPRA
jgi:hypothetical protein